MNVDVLTDVVMVPGTRLRWPARSVTAKQLYEFQTGAGRHAPVRTFEHKGKQYVLAFSGGSALIVI